MAFTTQESSRQDGRPVELYVIRYGRATGAEFRYTDSPIPLTVAGVTPSGDVFTPLALRRGDFKVEGVGKQGDLALTVSLASDLAGVFQGVLPSIPVALTVFRGHMPDAAVGTIDATILSSEFRPVWSGFIAEGRPDGGEMIFTCRSPTVEIMLPGLRRNYQVGCPHVLYGPRCKASKTAARTISSVASVGGDGTVNFADESWRRADATADDYVGGYVTWEGPDGDDFASILDATDTSLVLDGAQRGIIAGTELTIYLGCRHNLDDCLRLHVNRPNYGGQPWIPTENPLASNQFG